MHEAILPLVAAALSGLPSEHLSHLFSLFGTLPPPISSPYSLVTFSLVMHVLLHFYKPPFHCHVLKPFRALLVLNASPCFFVYLLRAFSVHCDLPSSLVPSRAFFVPLCLDS